MDVLIRLAETRDYPAIAGLLHKELGYPKLDKALLYQRMDRMAADEDFTTAVAEKDGTVVGFMGLNRRLSYNYDGEVIQIIALAVSESCQGQGIGGRLLRWAEDYARQLGIFDFIVSSGFQRLDAHRFYEGNGYRKTSYTFKKHVE